MPMLWAGIVRVSHVGARGGDTFHADEDQVAEIKRYAAQHGAQVEFMPPELSISGGSPIEKRPSLKAAIEGVEAGRYQGIVVAYLSRLTRSRSGIHIWERVEAVGGHVHCAQENVDTSTPSGRFIRDIYLANSVREREEHADRHDKRREVIVRAGLWRPRQTPKGYRFTGPIIDGRARGKGRRLVPSDDAELVRHAFANKVAGKSLTAIAASLGMTPSGARALLRNEVYLGVIRDGPYVNEQAHEPLVSRTLWEQAQNWRPRATRSGRPVALLAGLLRCASCGHVMTRRSDHGYGCVIYHSGHRCPAPANISRPRIDEYVQQLALDRLASAQASARRGDSELRKARDQHADAQRELRAYLSAVSAADVGEDAFREGALERRVRVGDTAAEIARLEAIGSNVVPFGGQVVRLWDTWDNERRNMVLRALFDAVVVRPVGRGVTIPVGQRVRVLRAGEAPDLRYRGGGAAVGIRPIELDGPVELGVVGPQDADDGV